MKYLFSLFILLFLFSPISYSLSINIDAPKEVLNEPITKQAIYDVQNLLRKACECTVGFENEEALIQIYLPQPNVDPFDKIKHVVDKNGIPNFFYPNTDFEWESHATKNGLSLRLYTDSYEGIAFALYALLQEKLGFQFYHPRSTIIPKIKVWPLDKDWNWKGKARFLKRGFHLHTMHPIELTEALLDEDHPNGLAMIKEYIDWLARNGQNYFEFNLLNSTQLDTWLPYAKTFVNYGHSKGIIMGVDISLNMIQQKAFKLYHKKPKSFRSKEKQVVERLERLAQANFDVYNIEMSSTEYTSGNSNKRQELMQVILNWARTNQVKIMGRAHVVKKGEAVLNYSGEQQKVKDDERGVMIHTVMFYGLQDEKAPVYGSPNLKHMQRLLEKEQAQRETWYFPESAYWVTFDNSVPMFLLPYLSTRLDDILNMEAQGIQGHLTFSSGWEWGYWLFDWSIARWSWDYGEETHLLDAFALLEKEEKIIQVLKSLHDLQNLYFKDKELMRYLVAQSVLDEVPKMMSREFHPRPRWRYPYLFNKSSMEDLDSFKLEGIETLAEFIRNYEPVLSTFHALILEKNKPSPILFEFYDGLKITLLRAKHRHACLQAIYAHRKEKLDKRVTRNYIQWVDKATQFRHLAQEIVNRRASTYSYDLKMLTTKRKGHTAYHFGYLYTVQNLHFWKREEEQIRQNRWKFPFMNIWNIGRIMGIIK